MQRGAAGHCSVFSASVCWDWEKSVEELELMPTPLSSGEMKEVRSVRWPGSKITDNCSEPPCGIFLCKRSEHPPPHPQVFPVVLVVLELALETRLASDHHPV